MELGLRGKRAVVTGASKGIGLAIADAFSEAGCDVVLAARDPAAAAEGLRARHQVRVEALALDLSEAAQRRRLFDAAAGADILVNNAGAIPSGNLASLTMDRWEEAWRLRAGCVETESPKTLNPANGQRLGHLREPMRTQHGLRCGATSTSRSSSPARCGRAGRGWCAT